MVLKVANLNTTINGKHILHDIDFDMAPGTITGLIGKNGAGKTTIMKSIIGLVKFQQGQITIDGQPVDFKHHQPLRNVRALIENPALYPDMTGKQHLQLYAIDLDVSQAEMDQIIQATGLTQFVNNKTKGYSLGMKQRLAIAITMLAKPKLIILDEPMNGLDPQSTHEMRALITKLAEEQQITFLISSHLLDELSKTANYFVIIKDGRVVKKGTLSEITNTKKLLHLQTSDLQATQEFLQALGVLSQIDGTRLIVDLTNYNLNDLLSHLLSQPEEILHVNEANADLETAFLDLLADK